MSEASRLYEIERELTRDMTFEARLALMAERGRLMAAASSLSRFSTMYSFRSRST